MKMNIGSVSSGYHFISLIDWVNAISTPPVPQSGNAAITATAPMTPNTRCPVSSSAIIEANMNRAISS
jgi:ribonucleotide reductase alpha subunit